jgi:hypothetical protein
MWVGRKFMKLLALIGITILTSCATSSGRQDYSKLSSVTYPAKPKNCAIEVFRSNQPKNEYEEIGIVEVFAGGTVSVFGGKMGGLEKNLPLMKELACKNGGDALFDVRGGSYGGSHTATVIRFKRNNRETSSNN